MQLPSSLLGGKLEKVVSQRVHKATRKFNIRRRAATGDEVIIGSFMLLSLYALQ